MKKIILALSMAVGAFTSSVQAQGTLWLNNYDSGFGVFQGAGTTSAALGTFVQVLAGQSAGTMVAVFATGGTYNGLNTFTITDNSGGTGGSFFDANLGAVPTVAPAATAFVQVLTWSGASTYALALTTAGAWSGSSSVFSEAVGTAIPAPPSSPAPSTLNIPGAIHESLTATPEPTTLALAGLGGLASLVMLRRKNA